jgi:hypothetical protein
MKISGSHTNLLSQLTKTAFLLGVVLRAIWKELSMKRLSVVFQFLMLCVTSSFGCAFVLALIPVIAQETVERAFAKSPLSESGE